MQLLQWMGEFVWSLSQGRLGNIVAGWLWRRSGLPPLGFAMAKATGFLCFLSFLGFPLHLGSP
jgi:hypothetical protein